MYRVFFLIAQVSFLNNFSLIWSIKMRLHSLVEKCLPFFSKKKLLKIHSPKAELWTIFGERNFTYICEHREREISFFFKERLISTSRVFLRFYARSLSLCSQMYVKFRSPKIVHNSALGEWIFKSFFLEKMGKHFSTRLWSLILIDQLNEKYSKN